MGWTLCFFLFVGLHRLPKFLSIEVKTSLLLSGSCPVEEKLPRAHFGENHLLISRHKSESCSENHGPGECGGPVTSSFDTVGFCAATAQLSTSNDCSQPLSGSNLMPPTMLQFAKTRKLSIERADPRKWVCRLLVLSLIIFWLYPCMILKWYQPTLV